MPRQMLRQMPRQMPRQMAGLQRPPMPGRVPPQQRMGTGIPMMAAAGGYVPNFADGGIIGYKTGDLVRSKGFSENYSVSPYTTDFGKPLVRQPFVNPVQQQNREKKLNIENLENQLSLLSQEPNTVENINLEKELKRQLQIAEETPVTGGGYESDTIFKEGDYRKTGRDSDEASARLDAEPTTLDAPGQGIIEKVIEEKKEEEFIEPNPFSGQVLYKNEAEEAAAFLNEYAANQGKDDLFKLEDAVLTGDDAVKAYEKRIGVSPFVALSEKYEQEIGENIAEAKKQSIGKMLFNFGSELTRSGQLGEAAVAAGRDIDKDMDRLIELKREERKVGFDIAKIAEAERQTKGKIGLTAEQQARKDNLTKSLKQKEFKILEEKNKIDSLYKDRTGRAALIRAGTERDYYKGQDSLGKLEDRIQAAVIQETFGGPGTANRKRFAKAEAIFLAAQTKNPGKSDDEVIDIAFANDRTGGEIFRRTKLLKEQNERIIRKAYQTSSSTKKPLFGKGLNDPLGLRNK